MWIIFFITVLSSVGLLVRACVIEASMGFGPALFWALPGFAGAVGSLYLYWVLVWLPIFT
ncbi:MAG: hypothetical protein WCT49_01475 [Candidatus Paceibacterota bacterium]|jgi:hypothetical protein|nr:hypothetical protein [Candidatus Paceibacterota bacterium]